MQILHTTCVAFSRFAFLLWIKFMPFLKKFVFCLLFIKFAQEFINILTLFMCVIRGMEGKGSTRSIK